MSRVAAECGWIGKGNAKEEKHGGGSALAHKPVEPTQYAGGDEKPLN